MYRPPFQIFNFHSMLPVPLSPLIIGLASMFSLKVLRQKGAHSYVTPPPDHTNVKQRGTLNLPMSPRFRVRGIDLSLIIYHPAVSQGPAGIHDKRRNYSSGSNAHEPHN